MKIWNFIKNNIYIKNFLLAIIITVLLVLLTLWWLNSYTQHDKAVIVPDVKGLPIEEAVPFLENNNLRYSVIDSVYSKKVAPGSIVETIPETGSKVKENRIIFIVVSAFGVETLVVPEIKDQSQRQAIAMLKAIGFKNINIEYVSGAYRDLVLGLKYNGKEITPGERIPVNGWLTLEVSSGNMEPESDSLDVLPAEEQEDSWF